MFADKVLSLINFVESKVVPNATQILEGIKTLTDYLKTWMSAPQPMQASDGIYSADIAGLKCYCQDVEAKSVDGHEPLHGFPVFLVPVLIDLLEKLFVKVVSDPAQPS